MARYFEPLIMAAIGTASKIVSSQQQMAVLDQTKTLAESALQMLYTAKEAGGNPKVNTTHTACEVLGSDATAFYCTFCFVQKDTIDRHVSLSSNNTTTHKKK
jgi:hypothetical protein